MGQGQSKNKERLIEILLVAFVIVTMALLIVQLGTNVLSTVNVAAPQSIQSSLPGSVGQPDAQPAERPTLDPGRWGDGGDFGDA